MAGFIGAQDTGCIRTLCPVPGPVDKFFKKSKMKKTRSGTLTNTLLFGTLAMLMVFSWSSCATKASFLTSSVAPAARGTVKVKKDGNNNYRIQIDLVNLAEVKRLQPARQTYVVWMESGQDAIRNIGQINSSTSMLSQKLKASFETVTSVKPNKIFITAEDDANIQNPGAQVVLSTDNF